MQNKYQQVRQSCVAVQFFHEEQQFFRDPHCWWFNRRRAEGNDKRNLRLNQVEKYVFSALCCNVCLRLSVTILSVSYSFTHRPPTVQIATNHYLSSILPSFLSLSLPPSLPSSLSPSLLPFLLCILLSSLPPSLPIFLTTAWHPAHAAVTLTSVSPSSCQNKVLFLWLSLVWIIFMKISTG